MGITLVVLVITIALIAAVAPGVLPSRPKLDDDTRKFAAGIIFAASYLALAIGKVPDAKTGKLLHQAHLDAGAIDGGVVTYEANGRQLIAVAAGDNNGTYKAKGDNVIVVLGLP